jgi:hypothetical protein
MQMGWYILNIKELISSLPKSVIRGEKMFMPDSAVRKMFALAQLKSTDVFYDLVCGNSNAIALASKEYGVKKLVGIEHRKIVSRKIGSRINKVENASFFNIDVGKVSLSDADVILYWYRNERLLPTLLKKFDKELKKGTRVVSFWSPPALVLPDKFDFPFFVSYAPLRYAENVQAQFKVIYGQNCIDFTGSWLLSQKYIDAIEVVPKQYTRFVTILTCMIIWINAWNMGLACEEQIPPPVKSYLGILRTFFSIDLLDMIRK